MFTKQIPHVRAPNPYTGETINLPISLADDLRALLAKPRTVPLRAVVIDGVTYNVPRGVYRFQSQSTWIVKINGRSFFFKDDRYRPSPKDSLAIATDFLLHNIDKDPYTLRQPEKTESRNKNIEFGVAGISAKWSRRINGRYSLLLRCQTYKGYTRLAFPITIRKENLTQVHLEDVIGMLVYMKHIVAVNPEFTPKVLSSIWERIKKGDISPPLSHPLPELTMVQLEENLEMRKEIWAGKGFVHPQTNKYTR